MKYHKTTLLEGFSFTFPDGQNTLLTGELFKGRGPIIAVDVINAGTLLFGNTNPVFNLQLNGVNVLEFDSYAEYSAFSNPGFYRPIPYRSKDGFKFKIECDNDTGQDFAQSVIFLRDGALNNVWDSPQKLTTWQMDEINPVTSGTNDFSGTIPKDRGRCVGFGLNGRRNINQITDDQINGTFSLEINGYILLQNVPGAVINSGCTRNYKKFFVPLKTGADFRLFTDNPTRLLSDLDLQFYFIDD